MRRILAEPWKSNIKNPLTDAILCAQFHFSQGSVFALLSRARAFFHPTSLLDVVICAGAAFASSVLSRHFSGRAVVPLAFLLVLVGVALIAGRIAGLAAAMVASFIFAAYLFEPYGSLFIRSGVEQIELFCFTLAAAGVLAFFPGREGLPLAGSGHIRRSASPEEGTPHFCSTCGIPCATNPEPRQRIPQQRDRPRPYIARKMLALPT